MYVLVAVQRTLNLFTDNFQWLHFKMVFFSITSGFEVKFRKKNKLRYNKWDCFYLFNSSVLCKTICCLSEILFTFFLLTKILIFFEKKCYSLNILLSPYIHEILGHCAMVLNN